MSEPAIELINAFVPLEEEVKTYLLENLERYSYPKKHLLISPGRKDRSLYLVRKGIVRVYKIIDGVERTSWFFPEGHFAVSLEGFYLGEPSHYYLEMLEDGDVTVIRADVTDYLLANYLSFNAFLIKAVCQSHYMVVKYMEELQLLTAEEKYENFVQERPELSHRVPLKYIASYLGMHEKNLSKIRSNFQSRQRKT